MAEYSTTVAPDKEVAVISDSEGEENDDNDGMVENFYDGSPHITLPPEVWAMVINYLPYDSLISCASTSKSMLHDALPLVTTLHIEKASQLRIGLVSNHLRDVRSISIYNLFHKDGNTNWNHQIDEDIATQSVPFLIASTFPQLKSIAFWGKCGDSNLLSLNTIIINHDQRGCIYSMVDALSGAFDCRTLPQNLQIVGLSCPNARVDMDGSCQTCKRVCNKFPLEVTGDIDLCLPYARSNEIIKTREGGRDYLHSETRLLQLLGKSHVSSSRNDFCIIGHDYEVRSELTRMVESSKLDVSKLNLDDVTKTIKKRHSNNSIYYLSGDSFDYLKTTIGISISNYLLDPDAVRLENLDRMSKHIIEETYSLQKSMGQMHSLLRKKSTRQDLPIQRLVESGVLPKLVESLSRDDYEVQLAATRILVNVAAGEREYIEEIVKLGAIPPLVYLLDSSHTELPFSAAWALGNITTGDVPHFRNLVLQAGVMRPLLKLLEDHQTSSVKLVRIYVWTLSNICGVKPKPDFNLISPSLQTLNELIHHSDEEVLKDACWALRGLTNGPNEHIQAVIDVLGDTGVCRLVELLEHPSTTVQSPALKSIGNIVSGDEAQTQFIIDNGALSSLLTLLSSSSMGILHDACWAISNIAAGTKAQVQAVIKSNIIPKVVSLLKDDSLATRKEAAWVVANCTVYGNSKQVNYLVKQGCISSMFDLLTVMQDDTKIVTIVLESLENASQVRMRDIKSFLGANNRRRMIEELQHHDDVVVQDLSTSILEMHFSSE